MSGKMLYFLQSSGHNLDVKEANYNNIATFHSIKRIQDIGQNYGLLYVLLYSNEIAGQDSDRILTLK